MLARAQPVMVQRRYTSRLSDKVRAAFEHACDDEDYVTAAELLATLEQVLLSTPPAAEQRDSVLGMLYDCQARLFHLRHAERTGGQDNSDGYKAEAAAT